MQVIKSITLLRKIIHNNKKTVGFVPTMGSLHEGHLSLLRKARRENDIVVLSIYVNPIQFNNAHDYRSYPRELKNDKKIGK